MKFFSDKFQNIGYKKLLVRLFTLLLAVILLDFIIGSLLGAFYFKLKFGYLYRTTYSIEQTKEDILIFGSSTATHDYNPRILEESLNMSSYNVGRDGNTILYDYAILKASLKRYTPKLIILDFDINEFKKTQESYDRLSSLLPYYKTHPEIQSIVDLRNRFEKIKLFSKIYSYNSLLLSIIAGNMQTFNIDYFDEKQIKKDFNIDGYFPLTNVWNKPIVVDNDPQNYELDTNKIKMYTAFIKNCITAKVKLYIVSSPVFVKEVYTSNSIILGKKIAAAYNVDFLDYSQDSSILNNPKWFADKSHLNDDGAKILSDKIKQKIIEDNITNNLPEE